LAGCSVIGATLNRSQAFQAYDIYSGWGFIALLMTLTAITFAKALPLGVLAIMMATGFALSRTLRQRYFAAPFWLLALGPGLLILTAINIAGVAKWDDFAEWVPNALYLFQFDSLPGHASPAPASASPGYPYALPFLTYLASWLAGGFLMQGGAMVNFLLLLSFASLLAGLSKSPCRPLGTSTIGLAALATLIVTLANPGFNSSFTITNQGDAATMVMTGALGILFWRLTNALREDDQSGCATLFVPLALSSMTLVLIKSTNVVLLVLLALGTLLNATKDKKLRPALLSVVAIILPAIIMHVVWTKYALTEIKGNGLAVLPFGLWRFDLARPLVQSILEEMVKKNGLSLLMLATSLYGLIGFLRPSTPLRGFALIAGVTYGGYLLFLTWAYIGISFTEAEIRRAASFYRYSSHIALLGITFVWLGAAEAWPVLRAKTPPGLLAFLTAPIGVAVLVLFLPVAFVLHHEWLVPQPGAEICRMRGFGHSLAAALPNNANVVVLEPETAGLFSYVLSLEFSLERTRGPKTETLEWFADMSKFGRDRTELPHYLARAEKAPVTTLCVPQSLQTPLEIEGFDNSQGPLVLQREGEHWRHLLPESGSL
ncbi:MAG: hypothetical protein M3N08_06230, partial [Pseudomonadota bacterium]|nr:hypothetical protein [Pseudomonadota bacterium]